MPFSHKNKKTCRKDYTQATGFLNKERNYDGESVLCTEEMLFPHLLYILYQIFRRAQIFVGFFCSRGRPGAAMGFSRADFLQKKISRARMHSQRTPRRKSLFFHKYSLAQNLSNFKCQFIHTVYHIFHQMQQQSRKTCRRYIPLSQPAVSA